MILGKKGGGACQAGFLLFDFRTYKAAEIGIFFFSNTIVQPLRHYVRNRDSKKSVVCPVIQFLKLESLRPCLATIDQGSVWIIGKTPIHF